jgi:hypothetical protein
MSSSDETEGKMRDGEEEEEEEEVAREMSEGDDMADEVSAPPTPAGSTGSGQVDEPMRVVPAELPIDRGILRMPEVFQRGGLRANDSFPSDMAAAILNKSEGDSHKYRNAYERCRARGEKLAIQLAKWETFSSLSDVQSLLYVAGSLILGPQVPAAIKPPHEWSPVLALAGGVMIALAFWIGTKRPTGKP